MVALFEDVFEYVVVVAAASDVIDSRPGRVGVAELRARIGRMQARSSPGRVVQTHPAIAGLLPGGALRAGAVYSVLGAAGSVVLAMLAGPSGAGAWCGVVGLPDFGAEAAARAGVDLERLVLVPQPGADWLGVTAALVDVLGVVVLAPPARARDGEVARLGARLRQREATVIVAGPWPQAEASLSVTGSGWDGLGAGHGFLSSHRVTVESVWRGGQIRRAQLWLPAPDERFYAVSPGAGSLRLQAVS